MALQTEKHIQRLYLPHLEHLVYATMTAHATDARIDVGAVVEVDIIRELVNPDPLDRLPRGIAFADFFKQRAIRFHLRVAVHANLGRRDSGVGGLVYGVMAVV